MPSETRNEIVAAPEEGLQTRAGAAPNYYGTEDGLDVREYLATFRRRGLAMATAAIAVFGTVVVTTKLQPKIYDASTKLVVSTKAVAGGGSDDGLLGGCLP